MSRHERVMGILAEAMELAGAPRAAFLESTCIGEPDLRREVEELLRFAPPALRAFDSASNQILQTHPKEIGPYTILEPVGEGGMAIVYKAQQHRPVRRLVAIKLIKLGMDTRQFVARFESERQALAMMDHPSVAKVHDAGSTDTGRPYFVMEFVSGQPILEYCDAHQLDTHRRLELFIQVCAAVEHAHRKGIIHRDLKNTNVLVGEVDGVAIPKVIDFGVAKAIARPLIEQALQTEQGQIIGTPEYMSPEQAERGMLDIDTRADVYSLGVLLYELIAGMQPISSSLLRSGGYAHVQQVIRDTEPPRPSTRLSAVGVEGADIARRRRIALPTLIRNLRSELEWIPLKAMRKDREQRYGSAGELADDIVNYLQGRPLLAGPESRRYRARKFFRRHRAAVLAAMAMLLLLTGGIIATSWQAVRATRAEARAAAERDSARATLAFFTEDVLAGAAPDKIRDAKVRQQIIDAMIAPAADSVGGKFADRPLIQASVRQAIQMVLREIGRADLALPHAEAALQIRRRDLGEDHLDTLTSLHDYGRVLRVLGRMDEAATTYQEVLQRRRRLLGDDHPDTISSLNNYASALEQLDRTAEAEPLFKEALERRRRLLGDDDPATIMSLHNYGNLLSTMQRFEAAEPYTKEALDRRRRVLGEDHPHTLISLGNLAYILKYLGRNAEAEPLYREALDKSRRVMGEDHPQTITALLNYAQVVRAQDRLAEALPLFEEVLDRRRRVLGSDHPNTAVALSAYAAVLYQLDRSAEAEPLAREALARATTNPALGPSHYLTRTFAATHANALGALGKNAEAAEVRSQFSLPARDQSATQPEE